MNLFNFKILRWIPVLFFGLMLFGCEEEGGVSLDEQRIRDEIIIRDYLTEFNITAQRTESGLHYQTLQEGTGAALAIGDTAVVHYTGWLLYGNIFDSSIYRDSPFEVVRGAGSVIAAWEEALSLMQEGDVVRIYVPSHLAYGRAGSPPAIPADAVLVFDIDLLDIKTRR